MLLEEGQISKTMFFIEEGCLRTCVNSDGKDITTQFFFEGDSVSSIESFRTNTPSLYSIESIEPCVLQTISQKDFHKIIRAPIRDAFKVLDANYEEASKRLKNKGILIGEACTIEEIWIKNNADPEEVIDLIME